MGSRQARPVPIAPPFGSDPLGIYPAAEAITILRTRVRLQEETAVHKRGFLWMSSPALLGITPKNQITQIDAAALAAALFVLIVAVAWYVGRSKSTVGSTPKDTLEQRAANEQQSTASQSLTPIAVSDVIGKRGEVFYYRVSHVGEFGVVHHKGYQGRSNGISVRVARGVTLRTGAFAGHQVDNARLAIVDRGNVYVSNNRFLFVGATHTIEVLLTHIVSAVDFVDGFEIHRTNATPMIFETDAPRSVAQVIRRLSAGNLAAAET